MPNHYIVPPPGQQFAPVVRRISGIAKSVGENFRIDKAMSTPRIVVGDKTLARWHELNAVRKAVDTEAAAQTAQRRAEAQAAREAEAAAAAAPPAPEVDEESTPDPEPEPEAAPKAPAKKAAAKKAAPRKRKSN